MSEIDPLVALRAALSGLDLAERERARTWAFSASGLLAASEGRIAQMEAEREVADAQDTLRRVKKALPLALHERSWASH